MPNLEEIKRERNKEQAVLAVSDRELTERYEKVFTAAVNDVLREMNLIYQTLPNTIMPLKENMKIAGVAFTIKGSKNLSLEDEMIDRGQLPPCILGTVPCP